MPKIVSPTLSIKLISADLTRRITRKKPDKLATPKNHPNFAAIGLVLIAVLVVAAVAIYFVYNQPKTDEDITPTPTPIASPIPSPTATPTVSPTPTLTPTPTPTPTASPTPAPTISVY